MEATDLQSLLLNKHGIRIEPEMIAYLLRKFDKLEAEAKEIPVIGGDARTGVPRRILVDLNQLISPSLANR